MSLYYFAGCGLEIYKPELTERVMSTLRAYDIHIKELATCCQIDQEFADKDIIITACPGCDERFSALGINTVTLWEYIADIGFHFPDYSKMPMAIHDSCSIRGKDMVYNAIRSLLQKMNIAIVEPEIYTRENSRCCGASMRGKATDADIEQQTIARLYELNANDVVVYCVGCMNKFVGHGKRIHHLLDLLFYEPTKPRVTNDLEWQSILLSYVNAMRQH